MLSVTALGDLDGRAPVLRSGARPGDVIAVAGPLGHSAAGLALLMAGAAAGASPAAAALVAAHLRPAPPYDAGPEAARLGATAMIDVSDGLVADLGHLAAASAVQVEVDSSALVTGGPLSDAAAVLDEIQPSEGTVPVGSRPQRALSWVLTGGEDHSLVAAFPASAALPARWRVIGAARPGTGVTVDGEPYLAAGGWQHFRQ
jgi:thiamine-monophosphate kinase